MANVLGAVRDLLTHMQKNHPWITGILITIVMFFSALGPILWAFGGFFVNLTLMAVAMRALSWATHGATAGMNIFQASLVAMNYLLSPLAIKVLIIGAAFFIIVVAIGLIAYNWDNLYGLMSANLANLKWMVEDFGNTLRENWDGAVQYFASWFAENKSTVNLDISIQDPGSQVSGFNYSGGGSSLATFAVGHNMGPGSGPQHPSSRPTPPGIRPIP